MNEFEAGQVGRPTIPIRLVRRRNRLAALQVNASMWEKREGIKRLRRSRFRSERRSTPPGTPFQVSAGCLLVRPLFSPAILRALGTRGRQCSIAPDSAREVDVACLGSVY